MIRTFFTPALCTVIFLALGLALIARVPLGRAPDEAAHWQYVEHLAERGSLPKFTGAAPPAPGYEFHQPPLYYVVCAPLWKIAGAGVQNYVCRLVSLIFGLLTLILVWQTARVLAPERLDLAVLSTGFCALWPLHLGVSSVSGNDSAAGFWCAALFFLVARGATEHWRWRHAILAGICIGLGLWTKTTTLTVSLMALGAAWELGHRNRAPRGAFWTVSGVSFLVTLPLLWRNQTLYGDPLGWRAFSQAATSGTPGFPEFSQMGLSAFVYFRGLILVLFSTAWGFFGGPDSAVKALAPFNPRPFPVALMPLTALCLLTTIVTTLGVVRLVENYRTPAALFLARWWGIGILLIILAWANFAYSHFSGAQARYLHPALLPICIGCAWAWTAVLGRGKLRLLFSVAFGLALLTLSLLNIFIWRTLV